MRRSVVIALWVIQPFCLYLITEENSCLPYAGAIIWGLSLVGLILLNKGNRRGN